MANKVLRALHQGLRGIIKADNLAVGVARDSIKDYLQYVAVATSGTVVNTTFGNVSLKLELSNAKVDVSNLKNGNIRLSITGGQLIFLAPMDPPSLDSIYRERDFSISDAEIVLVANENDAAGASFTVVDNKSDIQVQEASVTNPPNTRLIEKHYSGDSRQYEIEEAAICLNFRAATVRLIEAAVQFPKIRAALEKFKLSAPLAVNSQQENYFVLEGLCAPFEPSCGYIPRTDNISSSEVGAVGPTGCHEVADTYHDLPNYVVLLPRTTTIAQAGNQMVGWAVTDSNWGIETFVYWKYSLTATLDHVDVRFDENANKILLTGTWTPTGYGEYGAISPGCDLIKVRVGGGEIEDNKIITSVEATFCSDKEMLYLKGSWVVDTTNVKVGWDILGLGGGLAETAINAALGPKLCKRLSDGFQFPIIKLNIYQMQDNKDNNPMQAQNNMKFWAKDVSEATVLLGFYKG